MKDLNRDYRVSNLRIICVILVVFSHSIIIYMDGWNSYSTNVVSDFFNYLCQFIYLFHMPLFFSLSGYLAYYSFRKRLSFIDYAKKKFKRLIVPFLFVALLYMLPIRYVAQYPGYIHNSFSYNVFSNIFLGHDVGYLWFLPTLFLCFLFHFFSVKYIKNQKIIVILSILMFALSSFLPSYIGRLFFYYVWFNAGYLIRKHYTGHWKRYVKYFSAVLFSVFAAAYFLFPDTQYIRTILKFFVAFFAILLMYFTIPNKKPGRVMASIEKNGFGIYLFHPPLIYLVFSYCPDIQPYLMIFVNFIVLGSLAWLMSILLRKTKLKFIMGE